MQLLTFCLCVSLTTIAVYAIVQWDGMIFHPLKHYADLLLPTWARKPLYDCLVCMASAWTVTLWLLNRPLTFELIWAVLIVAGINTLVCMAIEQWTDYGC